MSASLGPSRSTDTNQTGLDAPRGNERAKMGIETTMLDVGRQVERWRHVHTWFHENRVNSKCPWCDR